MFFESLGYRLIAQSPQQRASEWDRTIKRFSSIHSKTKERKSRTWISLNHSITLPMVHRARGWKKIKYFQLASFRSFVSLEPARFQWKGEKKKEGKEMNRKELKTVQSHSRWNEKFQNSETVHIVRATTWRFTHKIFNSFASVVAWIGKALLRDFRLIANSLTRDGHWHHNNKHRSVRL